MSQKTDTQVVIGNKVLTLSGYESAEYQQKIANYVNEKLEELDAIDGFRFQSAEMKAILTEINIADDLMKAKNQIEILSQQLSERENEITDFKHELISNQMKLDTAHNQISELQNKLSEKSQDIIRLETQLKEKNSNSKK